MWSNLLESRATTAEEKVLAFEMVIRVAKEEAIQAIVRYKVSEAFEDDVSEAVCNAFCKGFDECKKKVALTFDHLDLHDIVPDDPKDDGSTPTEQSAKASLAPAALSPQQEIVAQAMAETGAPPNAAMGACECGKALPPRP